MNASIDLDERFAELAHEIGSRGELAQIVLQHTGDQTSQTPPPAPSWPRRVPPAWRWATALAASVLVVATIWLVPTSRSLSAQMLSALGRVETVHVVGSTNRIVRRWPLEDPAQAQTAGEVSVEAWFWTDEHGVARSYEKQGPVTRTRRGGDTREYQQDVDLLYISEGGSAKDGVRRFSQLTDYLLALERPGMIKRDLGTRKEGDVTLRGLELRHGGRVRTVWWDVSTFLPVRMSESSFSGDGKIKESLLSVEYDQPVPASVANYQAPQAKHVRYSGSDKASLAWRQHVEEIGRQLHEQPLADRVAVLPRKNGRRFSLSWTLTTPDGRYKVTPLCGEMDALSKLSDCVQLQFATLDPQRRLATWRVPEEFHELVLRHDVVYEVGVPWQEWTQAVLAHFGLEYVDIEETQAVWIAHHDKDSHKPARPVDPPVPYIVEGGIEKKGLVKCGVGQRLRPVTLKTLFRDFNRLQAKDLHGDSIVIEDRTGLPRPPAFDKQVHGSWQEYWKNVVEPNYVTATDSPYFHGPGSVEMARKWYRDEFGITFTEETRPITIHVVRRKQP